MIPLGSSLFVIQGQVIKAGSALGGNKGRRKNTSPKRKSKPRTTPKTPLKSAYRPKPPKQNTVTNAVMNGEKYFHLDMISCV